MYHIAGLVRWNRDREQASIEEEDRGHMRQRGTGKDRPGTLRCYAPELRSSVNTLTQAVYGRAVIKERVMGKYTGKYLRSLLPVIKQHAIHLMVICLRYVRCHFGMQHQA